MKHVYERRETCSFAATTTITEPVIVGEGVGVCVRACEVDDSYLQTGNREESCFNSRAAGLGALGSLGSPTLVWGEKCVVARLQATVVASLMQHPGRSLQVPNKNKSPPEPLGSERAPMTLTKKKKSFLQEAPPLPIRLNRRIFQYAVCAQLDSESCSRGRGDTHKWRFVITRFSGCLGT